MKEETQLSKHNYSQYSNKNRQNDQNQKPKQVENTPVTAVPEAKPVVNLVKETVETVSLPATVKGHVVNCAKLNVRENATVNSYVVCVLDARAEIEVDVNKSTDKWMYVYTATGAEGYCMREYIDAHL
jgi:hypothetical protein